MSLWMSGVHLLAFVFCPCDALSSLGLLGFCDAPVVSIPAQ